MSACVKLHSQLKWIESHSIAGDPLLRALQTTVVSVSVSQPPPVLEKKTKKAVLAPEVPNEPVLHVLLHDTVIFPEGGGQPTDTGDIITADGAVWEVVQAKRHGGHAVHYVKIRDGVGIDAALLALQPGKQVTVSLGDKGYERRYDHVSRTDGKKQTRTYRPLPRCPCIPRSTCSPRYSKHD